MPPIVGSHPHPGTKRQHTPWEGSHPLSFSSRPPLTHAGYPMEILNVLLRPLQIDVTPSIFALVCAATLVAGVTDWLWYRVSNKITFPLLAAGIVYHLWLPPGRGWMFALSGFAFGLSILLPFFLLGGVGAGDVKLLAAIGSCLGLHDTVAIFLVFGALAVVYSAAATLARGRRLSLGKLFRHSYRVASTTISEGHRIEEAVEKNEKSRRLRMVPLATMMALALTMLVVGHWAPSMLLY